MREKTQLESFFQGSSIRLKSFCYSSFGKEMLEQEWFAVGGKVTEIVGHPKGVFVGSHVIVFMTENEVREADCVQLDMRKVFLVPRDVTLKDAVAVTKYLCQINAVRECAVPLCSSYQLTNPDCSFERLLDAMGYNQARDKNVDFWIDVNDSLVGKVQPIGCSVLLWSLLFNNKKVRPGADWEMLKDGSEEALKYPDAYIRTKLCDNIAFYFDLVIRGKLRPDTSEVQDLFEVDENSEEAVSKELGLFQPYESLIENRMKPLVGIYVVNKEDKEAESFVREVDSWIGLRHSVFRELPEGVKLGYPDGSVVDIMYVEGRTKHIELHFNGISIIYENGITKKY